MDCLHKIDILMPVGEKGGVENVVAGTAVYLQDRGYQIRVVQLVWERVNWVPESIPFYPLSEGRGHYSLDQFVEKYTGFMGEQGTPDLILATTWPTMVLVAKLSMLAYPQAHAKIVSWLHGPLEQYVKAGFGGMECLEKADAVFVLNQRTQDMLLRNLNCRNINIVRNPVDFRHCPVRADQQSDHHCLLFVGRISKEKRLDIVIRALHETQEMWHLRIVGDGEERAAVERLVQELSLQERVEFLGWQEDPWVHTGGVTAAILSSEYECFPLAAVESLACGIPVIAPPVDGIVELIEPETNGYLYSPGNSKELALLLDRIAAGEVSAAIPEVCRNSVTDYEESRALADFEEKLIGVLDKISVIIPCYNVQKQIAVCLDSVFAQELHGVNLEVICVDDQSTDDTVQILKRYEERYSDHLLLVLLEENGRQGNARNIGMQYASGDYITFVDADDRIDPKMLGALYDRMAGTPCDIAECAYKQMRWEDEPAVEVRGKPEYYDMQNMEHKKAYLLRYGWKTGPWGRLYRRDFFLEHPIFFPTDINMEDIYFSEYCMLFMKHYVRIPQTYYFYCENDAGVMHSDGILHYYMDTAKVQNMTTQMVMKEGMLQGCEEEYAYLHFSKAFVEPVDRMWRDERFFSYENFEYLKETLFQFFPDFLDNPYFVRDTSRLMGFYRTLLQRDWTEEELRDAMCRQREDNHYTTDNRILSPDGKGM